MSPEQLLLLLIGTPGTVFLALGLAWLLGIQLSERVVARLTALTYSVLAVAVLVLGWRLWSLDWPTVRVTLGEWFHVAQYHFTLTLLLDRLSLPLVGVTVVLAGLVGAFSVRYLHRDPGYFRFFLLLHLFTFGALLVFLADSLDVLLAGWEIVGITSVLLIGFFQYRPDPVRNALRVFGIYRVADLCMLLAVFFAHHWLKSATWDGLFSGEWPHHQLRTSDQAVGGIIAVLLVLAASGKSAQGPFCGWLVRAMEGPTPSSAIFYGAISVHAGAYLLLRIEPLLRQFPVAAGLVVFIGLATAFLGTLVHRTCADVKTSLAYAAQTQLGLIFAEIGLGWTTFAVLHLVSHALLRTLQFLRAPSMLRDYHRVHAAAGGQIDPTGEHYESLLPKPVQLALYRIALGRGFYDAILDRFVIAPAVAVARWVGVFERPFPSATAPLQAKDLDASRGQ